MPDLSQFESTPWLLPLGVILSLLLIWLIYRYFRGRSSALERALAAISFERIDGLIIPNADDGFLMVFSAGPFPDADFDLDWLREEGGGNVYTGRFEVEGEVQEMEGWLCPALTLYYPDPPQKLYVQIREAK